MAKKVFLRTWGCQMNVLDSEVLQGQFTEAGYSLAEDIEDADVIIFNTCSVREHAENKVFSHIGRLKLIKARKPDVTVVVAGCVAERLGGELSARYPQVDFVIGTRNLGNCLKLVQGAKRRGVLIGDAEQSYPPRYPGQRRGRRQAFVSVMRGCDNFCAYCIVPYVRGRQVSRAEAEILDEVKALADEGVKEVTLLGQNVTAYGRDRSDRGALCGLLEAIEGVAGIQWVKFVTSHPRDTGEDVFRAMRDLPKVCRYLHLPAQSGSDHVLAAMKRGYTRSEYLAKIDLLRRTVGEVSLAGDFIVGFPGETEADFQDTASLVREVGYKNCFIFKYSPRDKTAAALLRDDVPIADKKRRNNDLLAVQAAASRAHNGSFVGKTAKVLVDGREKKSGRRLSGRTEGEEIVIFEGVQDLVGEFVDVRVTEATAIALFGEIAGRGGSTVRGR